MKPANHNTPTPCQAMSTALYALAEVHHEYAAKRETGNLDAEDIGRYYQHVTMAMYKLWDALLAQAEQDILQTEGV